MFEREVIIAGLRKQRSMFQELIEDFEGKSSLEHGDLQYCKEILKAIETATKKLRQSCDSLVANF